MSRPGPTVRGRERRPGRGRSAQRGTVKRGRTATEPRGKVPAAACVLLLPWLAMQFTEEAAWGVGDRERDTRRSKARAA